jgi:glycosyltransferase involved in cell wall biosynthesis
VIVVDDCSTDGSLGLIKDLNNEFVIIKHKHNSGVAIASNTGLYAASGDYWMRVDADDYLSLMALQYMSSILDANSEIGFVYSDHLRIDSSIDKPKRIRLNSIEKLLNHGAGVLFRRDLLLEIGGYDKSLRNGEDFDLIARLIKGGVSGFHLPIPLYRYFVQENGLTNESNRKNIINKLGEKYDV